MTSINHAQETQLGSSTALPIEIRPLRLDDRAYVRATWAHAYKESSRRLLQTPWSIFKQTIVRDLEAVADSSSMLGAFSPDNRIVGWLAFSPGSRVDTIHFAYTRSKLDDVETRRRGVMSALIDAAEIGSRIVYTHRGARPVKHRGRSGRSETAARHVPHGETTDVPIAEWLRSRGRSVVFVPYEEWKR